MSGRNNSGQAWILHVLRCPHPEKHVDDADVLEVQVLLVVLEGVPHGWEWAVDNVEDAPHAILLKRGVIILGTVGCGKRLTLDA